MRKDLKKTGLFALVVFLFLTFVIFEINNFKEEESVKETKNRVVKIESVNRVETDGFVFEKIGFNWKATEGEFTDFLGNALVEDWLSKALTQDGRALSEKDEEVSWDKFGFTEDSRTIVLRSDDRSVKITLSDMKSFDGGSYLKVLEDKKTLYSSGAEWFEFFDKNLNSLRDENAFNWDRLEKKGHLSSLTIANSLKLLFKDNKWFSESHQGWSFDKIEGFVEDVKKHKILEFLDEKPKALKYGDLSIKTDQGDEYILTVYKKGQDFFAENSFRPNVFFSLDKENIDTFFPKAYHLRSFSDVLSFNQDEVKSISYKALKSFSFSKKDSGEWRLDSPSEGKVFNGASILKLFSLMKNINPERYFGKKPPRSKASLSVLRKNKEGKQQSFKIYKKEHSCVEGEDKKDCYMLVVNEQTLAVKKANVKELFDLKFFKKNNDLKEVKNVSE